jgi:hypothetical protein
MLKGRKTCEISLMRRGSGQVGDVSGRPGFDWEREVEWRDMVVERETLGQFPPSFLLQGLRQRDRSSNEDDRSSVQEHDTHI